MVNIVTMIDGAILEEEVHITYMVFIDLGRCQWVPREVLRKVLEKEEVHITYI